MNKYSMRYKDFATKPQQAPVVATPNANPPPRLTLAQQRAVVQQRKLQALIQQRANSELQQQAKVTELDKVKAIMAVGDMTRLRK
jgi:hypothetical protein